MKHSAIVLVVFFGALPGHPPSCNEEGKKNNQVSEVPCIAYDVVHHPENFPDLCGDTPTSTNCTKVVPQFPSRTLSVGSFQTLIEVLKGMENFTGEIESGDGREWVLQEIEHGTVLIKDIPDYYGIPVLIPFAYLRSNQDSPGIGSIMSLYFCISDIRGECIIDSVMIISWKVIGESGVFTKDFEASGKVFALRGNCPEEIKVGDTWKTWGELHLPEG